jgi:hypothetical protein
MTAQELHDEIKSLQVALGPGMRAYARDIERIREVLKETVKLIESEWGPMGE